MSRPVPYSSGIDDATDWDDPSLWTEPVGAQRFSFGGSSPRDIAVSIAIVVVPIVVLLLGLSLLGLGEAGTTGGGG